jgi:hypothetical protein
MEEHRPKKLLDQVRDAIRLREWSLELKMSEAFQAPIP